jgi:serine/threonine protein phosphatase PrpC
VATVHDNSVHGEDRYLVRALGDDAVLDAVMDGVTSRGGAQASQRLVDALAAAPLTSAADVVAVIDDVNRRLYDIGRGRFFLTTVATALYRDGWLSVMGAGDSPVYLIRPHTCHRLFSPVRGLLLGAGAQPVHLYHAEVRIEPGDRLLLATDGITDNIASRELAEIVRHATTPENAATHISAMIASLLTQRVRPGPVRTSFHGDDCTAILRFFSHG